MRWTTELSAFSLSIGCSLVLAASCGTPGLGVDPSSFHAGGAASTSSSSTGGGTGGTQFFFDSGSSDATFGECVPLTCTELSANCGPMGDGCGGLVQCGDCKSPTTCGGGGIRSNCGGNNGCQPKTCADLGIDCGPAGDGCGGLLQCGTCVSPKTCGGGGTPSVCGGTAGCVPTTCAAQNVNCGPIGDGCGGILQCGSCITPQTCGGGGVPSVCGDGSVDAGDAGNNCVPKTCADLGNPCGPAGDGCGGQLTCGTCAPPQTCGGGGTPSVCGGTTGCVPRTCAQQGINCGPAGDGCGGQLTCGTCAAPQTCGGGTSDGGSPRPGVCGGSNNCVPLTCAQLGFNCGAAGDGCGGLLDCGPTCPGGQICGGGGQPGVCGPTDAGALGCTGLCLQQTTCPLADAGPDAGNASTTTITGTVYAPNGTDPLYNALVYVPNGAAGSPTWGVTAFTPGVHCGQCGSEVSGSPLVSTTSAPDGTFQLTNVPAGANIPLVIQLGRWRRKITIPNVPACSTTTLTTAQTSLPAEEAQFDPADNIPLMAFATGQVDGLECVLLRIGIHSNQFSDPAAQGGNGRVRFYLGEGAAGAQISANTPSAKQLWGSAADLDGGTPDIDQYDMVYFPCQGGEYTKTAAEQSVIVNYANAGGRIFATHYSYVWFINAVNGVDGGPGNNPFSTVANWAPNDNTNAGNGTGFINTSFTRGQALAQWLQIVGASTTYAQMPLTVMREDFTNVVSPTLLWVSTGAPPTGSFTLPMHMTFDTPVGNTPATQCGRAIFDDFHVEDDSNTHTTGKTFPNECPAASVATTAQEKMLEFMIFDLSSCIIPTVTTPPTCASLNCTQRGFDCGPADDGCGNQIDCGTCVAPETCGGGGVPGNCGGTACMPIDCPSQGIQCGPAGDGCGDLIQCGNCPNGETCGGGGVPGKCGKTTCNPITCASQGIQCGPAGDGCGGVLVCGSCPPGELCGYGGKPGKCGAPDAGACTPITCAEQNLSCGPAGNGCGGQLDCGPCTAPQTCGGGGTPGVCGAPSCTTTTCTAQNIECGPAGDGCGGLLQCGTCPPNETCGGGGVPGMCGSGCVPATCQTLGFTCGPAGDGCGGLLQCGTCVAPDVCGGGGVAGQCGHEQTN